MIMQKKRKKTALVTGASSGIGKEFVRQIAESCPFVDEIWVIARHETALLALQREIPSVSIRVLPLDLQDSGDLSRLKNLLREERPGICFLVNSAGVGYAGRVEEGGRKETLSMIDINCRALTEVTLLALPYLCRGARILQMASGAAFLPQPGFAVYAASKAYVLSFSRALGVELRRRRLHVTAVCPGPVRTGFFETGHISLSPEKEKFLVSPEKVVRQALRDAAKRKPVSVCGLPMKFVWFASEILPQSVMLFLSRLFIKI